MIQNPTSEKLLLLFVLLLGISLLLVTWATTNYQSDTIFWLLFRFLEVGHVFLLCVIAGAWLVLEQKRGQDIAC